MQTNNEKIEAKRGSIYTFCDACGNPTGNYVLVISDDSRSRDKYVSILMFGDSDLGPDVISYEIRPQIVKYLHCGMVSYTSRDKLGKCVGQLESDDMQKVDQMILRQLGLVERVDYKVLYEELINKLIANKISI